MNTSVLRSAASRILVAAALSLAFALPTSARQTSITQTQVVTGNVGTVIPAGFTTLQSSKASCATKTCTLVLSAMAQIGNCEGAGGWKIQVLVDGGQVDFGPLQGPQPMNTYVVGHWQGFVAVKSGSHTITLQVYTDTVCMAGLWSANWSIGSP